ncbi:MAG: DUF4142 domain-containing protein [Bacteroidetes bacterium]|nr:DUF4142 domain-containing protein [Bacteroidota bacterium]HET6244339.1 DUF4142 domain-containing protein [Bacteroidia bacterium]
MKTKFFIGLCAFGLMLNIACETGTKNEDPVEKAQERTEERIMDDKTAEILTETASMNMMNMELSRIAEEKAVTPEVQQFAKDIATEHREIQSELEALAQKEPVVLPGTMSDDHQDKINSVTDNEGIDFDKEYVDEIKSNYQDKINDFESLARETDIPEIREFALNTLPRLRTQLEKVESIEEQLKDSEKGVLEGDAFDTEGNSENNAQRDI